MLWHICALSICVLSIAAYEKSSDSYEDDLYSDEDDLRERWIYLPDDDGVFHKAMMGAPSDRLLGLDSPSEITTYTLYTRKKPMGQLLTNGKTSLKKSDFSISRSTKIVTHGWMSRGTAKICQTIKDAYLKKGNYNVIVFDWSPISRSINYLASVWNVGALGHELAKFIEMLFQLGVKPWSVHMVGHSVGAHIVGVAGARLKHKIHRITGLDPAGVGFYFVDNKLQPDAAVFVDVIHTAAGTVGYEGPLGKADFFPNGGMRQPGCDNDFTGSDPGCDHAKSWHYFSSSIVHHKKYPAKKCTSYKNFKRNACSKYIVYMGESAPINISGRYYLFTGKDDK